MDFSKFIEIIAHFPVGRVFDITVKGTTSSSAQLLHCCFYWKMCS